MNIEIGDTICSLLCTVLCSRIGGFTDTDSGKIHGTCKGQCGQTWTRIDA